MLGVVVQLHTARSPELGVKALKGGSTRSGAGPSDAALVLAARAGEAWAQEAIFRRHASRINGLAYRILGRDDEVDDLVQDAFFAAFRSLASLRDGDAFASWLSGIVVRQAYKRIRRKKLLRRFGFGAASSAIDFDQIVSPLAPPDHTAELRALYAMLDALPAGVRVPLVLHRVEGMGLEEVATVTGWSVATVKRRIAEGHLLLQSATGGRS